MAFRGPVGGGRISPHIPDVGTAPWCPPASVLYTNGADKIPPFLGLPHEAFLRRVIGPRRGDRLDCYSYGEVHVHLVDPEDLDLGDVDLDLFRFCPESQGERSV